MANDVNLGDVHECNTNDILQCPSYNRIKITLSKVQTVIEYHDNSDCANLFDAVHDIIHRAIDEHSYDASNLLNDYHHLKYGHVATNFGALHQINEQLNKNQCDIANCDHVRRHYADRMLIHNAKKEHKEK